MAAHTWDEPWGFMDKVYSTCAVCGGVRVRDRLAGVDYFNIGTMAIDMAPDTRKGWQYEDTPRSCPGEPQHNAAPDANDLGSHHTPRKAE